MISPSLYEYLFEQLFSHILHCFEPQEVRTAATLNAAKRQTRAFFMVMYSFGNPYVKINIPQFCKNVKCYLPKNVRSLCVLTESTRPMAIYVLSAEEPP